MSECSQGHQTFIIPKNKSQEFRIRTLSYVERRFIDVRVWEKNPYNESYHPTRHGLTASPKAWKEILAAFQKTDWTYLEDHPVSNSSPHPEKKHSEAGGVGNETPPAPAKSYPRRDDFRRKASWNKPLHTSRKPLE